MIIFYIIAPALSYLIDQHYQPLNWFQYGDTTCYGVMFDAGSSGTRVYVYSWSCRENKTMAYINITEKTLEYKVEPGIDSFGKDLESLKSYIDDLIQFAYENVPYNMHKYTPIMLAATAGMRMIPTFYQIQIISTIRDIFRSSKFLFHRDDWCRIITGQEEGAYMWLSINYMIGKLGITDNEHALTVDLGGGSTQLAFKPKQNIDNSEVNLRIPNHNQYKIYSQSYLYYGIDQAKKVIFENEMKKLDKNNLVYQSPCFHNGYRNTYKYNSSYIIIGTGNINKCVDLINQYLNNDKSKCIYENCGINGVYQPEIDSELIYGLGGVQFMAEFLNLEEYTLEQYFINAVKFCTLSYEEIQQHEIYSKNKYSNGNYFSVLYVYSLLSHGYGIKQNQIIRSPKLIGNITPTWTLAAMFYQIAQIDCEQDSPICSTIMNN
ncbi:unnamed protein product [Paramecium pentaurelia]|uniref:Apyrase n=1 Tax=Paramecium pentaurelia TaxID=43138 RepID=A0A8S1X8B4_9CILI|nr:unnamed protein product [Paramecium pentaurelia]